LNFVRSQIYRNIIDSLHLADKSGSFHLMPMEDDDKILEELTYQLVSLLRRPVNKEKLSPKQYALTLMETKEEWINEKTL
jgi:hypothetical protein